jgi:hypothetical protein
MRNITKIITAALAAALLLSLFASTASARRRLEVSTTATLLSGRLTFTEPVRGDQVISDITLHVTLNRLINKIHLEHVGDITAVLTANVRCTREPCQVTPLVPMLVAYGSIRGSLPNNIRGILLLILVAFLLLIFFFARCLFRGLIGAESPTNPASVFTPLRGTADLIPLWEDRLDQSEECPERGILTGSLTARPTVTIRLLEP